ncbi:MAG: tetratricopeptide repeat protein [Gammaproteobacteria bacterium]
MAAGLAGCAVPSYPGGAAPVVDRSVYRNAQPQPSPLPPQSTVEVTPLQQPTPIVPEQQIARVPPPAPPVPVRPEPPPPAAQPAPPPAEPSLAPEPEGNKAVVALLDNAAEAVSSGNLDQAASALERALRIEPRNASIWHDLGQIRLHQRKFTQAESMAEKSNGLAGGNNALKARNWRLIAVARRAAGDTAGADAAEAQAVILER